MNIPQILMMVWFALFLLLAANKHGKRMPDGKYSFWAYAWICALQVGLLTWGGFWS